MWYLSCGISIILGPFISHMDILLWLSNGQSFTGNYIFICPRTHPRGTSKHMCKFMTLPCWQRCMYASDSTTFWVFVLSISCILCKWLVWCITVCKLILFIIYLLSHSIHYLFIINMSGKITTVYNSIVLMVLCVLLVHRVAVRVIWFFCSQGPCGSLLMSTDLVLSTAGTRLPCSMGLKRTTVSPQWFLPNQPV